MKIQKKKFSLIIWGLAIAVMSSCTKAVIDPENAGSVEPVTEPESAVFNPDVRDIMQNHCVTCHGGGAPSAGLDLNTYAVVKQNTEFGNIVQRLNSATSPMPASGMLSQEKRSIIDKWVTDGYPEN